jgi:hypothetical protein
VEERRGAWGLSQLADLLQVIRVLSATGTDGDRAAEMLGLKRVRQVRPTRVSAPRADTAPDHAMTAPSTETPQDGREGGVPLRATLKWEHAPSSVAQSWVETPPVTAEALRYRRARIELEPLLQPLSERAILSALVATPAEGAPDVEKMAALIADRQPIRRMLYQIVDTVTRGVQVLVDRSRSMMPFRRDQDYVVTQLRRVIGAGRVEVLDFMECPSRNAGIGAVSRWKTYRPPPPRTPVLLLTDLAIGREQYDGATTAEWLAFARGVQTGNCPLLAIVPYAPRRWPRELVQAMAILQWDRSLTARAARRSLR